MDAIIGWVGGDDPMTRVASEGHMANAATAHAMQGRQTAGRTVNRKITGGMFFGKARLGCRGCGFTRFGLGLREAFLAIGFVFVIVFSICNCNFMRIRICPCICICVCVNICT